MQSLLKSFLAIFANPIEIKKTRISKESDSISYHRFVQHSQLDNAIWNFPEFDAQNIKLKCKQVLKLYYKFQFLCITFVFDTAVLQFSF